LRLIWAGVARLALASGAGRLLGCTSFPGTKPPPAPALALLAARHLGPKALRPGHKAPETLPLPAPDAADPQATAHLPPLLRSYLAFGAWVGDHLVIDRDLGTCHIFTCLEITALPEARKRALLRLAAG
jgi:putative hemolysin